MAGRHRGGGVAVLARSVLAQESLEASEAVIKQKRDIDLPGLLRDHIVGPWLADMRRTSYDGGWGSAAMFSQAERRQGT